MNEDDIYVITPDDDGPKTVNFKVYEETGLDLWKYERGPDHGVNFTERVPIDQDPEGMELGCPHPFVPEGVWLFTVEKSGDSYVAVSGKTAASMAHSENGFWKALSFVNLEALKRIKIKDVDN